MMKDKNHTGSTARFHFDNAYYNNPKYYDAILLYQVGDLSSGSNFSIGNHLQSCYEISYIVSGSGYYSSNDKHYPVKAGDIYLSLPGERHNGHADAGDPFRYFYVGFDFDPTSDDYRNYVNVKRMFDQVNMPLVEDKFGVNKQFLGIFSELINLQEHSEVLIQSYLTQIILLTYRNFFDRHNKKYMGCEDNETDLVYEIVHHIDSQLENGAIIKLSMLGETLGYSYSHLSHHFSQNTGYTLKQYLDNKRFEKALEWLAETTSTITEISEKLGYQSIHTFSRAFRLSYGISPTAYRQMMLGKVVE